MQKRGFTIVELLMVITIIAVLMGIVTTAASTSIRMARSRKAQALCTMVEAGLATYHAQGNLKWPDAMPINRSPDSDENYVELTASEVQRCVRALVEKTRQGSPVMDISGLFVSSDPGETGRAYGLDFMQAATIKGMASAKSKLRSLNGGKRLTVAQMYFGYPDASTGRFRRFHIRYYPASDSVTVSQN